MTLETSISSILNVLGLFTHRPSSYGEFLALILSVAFLALEAVLVCLLARIFIARDSQFLERYFGEITEEMKRGCAP
jgi:hypothetical protein